jgi:uncharacterized protein (TIGR03067 family)
MRMQGVLLVVGGLIAAKAVAEPAPETHPETQRKKALSQLEGKWTLVAETRDGRPTPEAELKARRMTLHVRSAAISVRSADAVEEVFRMEIDPGDSPRGIELYARGYETIGVQDGKTVRRQVGVELLSRRGIYSLEDDTLKICLVLADESRPTRFTTDGRKNGVLRVYRRD